MISIVSKSFDRKTTEIVENGDDSVMKIKRENLNYLYKMNRLQIEALQRKGCGIAFIPMGPTEVHGPHLPLMTDITSGLELAERAAYKLRAEGIESIIATPVTYCHADVTNCFAGNTSLRTETVTMLIEDICLSLARAGFVYIVVTSGHADPSNAAAVQQGFENAKTKDPRIKALHSDWFTMGIVEGRAAQAFAGKHPEWDLHAGESETAFNMMRNPELLDMVQIKKLPPNYEGEFLFPRIGAGAADFLECGAPDAYFGDPAVATAENGDRQYDIFSDIIVGEVKTLIS